MIDHSDRNFGITLLQIIYSEKTKSNFLIPKTLKSTCSEEINPDGNISNDELYLFLLPGSIMSRVLQQKASIEKVRSRGPIIDF